MNENEGRECAVIPVRLHLDMGKHVPLPNLNAESKSLAWPLSVISVEYFLLPML